MRRRPRVLVAPNAFKGCCTALQAARAMAKGVRAAGAVPRLLPIADGGDGLIEALLFSRGGRRMKAPAADPLGRKRKAAFAMIGRIAVIEMARASGLALLKKKELDAMRATSKGTGQLIAAALDRGAKELWIGLGGSATNDGGAGMAGALGARLLDRKGLPIGPGPEGLLKLHRLDVSAMHPRLARARLRLVSDVSNPLLGARGSARVYGPQKGATPAQVKKIEKALARLARVVRRDLGKDVAKTPGAGAAGGLGYGLLAFTNAALLPGSSFVLDAVKAERRVRGSDLVLTGEGRFDRQSLDGKAPAELAKLASRYGRPVGLVCGQLQAGLAPRLKELGIGAVVNLSARRRPEQAMKQAPRLLANAAKLLTAAAWA